MVKNPPNSGELVTAYVRRPSTRTSSRREEGAGTFVINSFLCFCGESVREQGRRAQGGGRCVRQQRQGEGIYGDLVCGVFLFFWSLNGRTRWTDGLEERERIMSEG